jgi:chromate transporter
MRADHSPAEVLRAFLKLGSMSFGGPIAHLGYFREEFVTRRGWLDDATYTDLVALCQFLPGPASSQVGLSIGLVRAGYLGGLAAWVGFTLPSAAVMVCFAFGAATFTGPLGMGMLHGLKLVAVAIIAHAVAGMARTLCPDRERAAIAAAASALVLFGGSSSVAQIAVILMGAVAGLWFCRDPPAPPASPLASPVSRRVGYASLALFALLLLGLPLVRAHPGVGLFEAFYRSGALVFGGGHVVLPLLRNAFVIPGWVSDNTFLAGYGAAQAVPGPLFTFAAYLGAVAAPPPHGLPGAVLGLIGIFLPGLLILMGALPFWSTLRQRSGARAAMSGVNASVVGLLAAALYTPVWTSSVGTAADVGVAIIGFVALGAWRVPPLAVVIAGAFAGVALSLVT